MVETSQEWIVERLAQLETENRRPGLQGSVDGADRNYIARWPLGRGDGRRFHVAQSRSKPRLTRKEGSG